MKNVYYDRLHFNLVEGAAKKVRNHEDADEELQGVRGLIDIASSIQWDGPRCFLCADELSLVIGSVAGKKSGGCMSFDDLICFLDEERRSSAK